MVLLSAESAVSITGQNIGLFPFLLPSLFSLLGEEVAGAVAHPVAKQAPAEQEAGWRCCTPLTWASVARLATRVSGVAREPTPFPALSFFGKLG